MRRQVKLAALLMSPLPTYSATFGQLQTGRERVRLPLESNFVAMRRSGATPCSTHLMTALTAWWSASRKAFGGSG